ncbi:hypothetical protein EYC84_007860 [Monilinia fructicola]|uniref:Uncharacterized protein n=1 Tax=Monilinia fructicola TaxID=38448 RepID=A0A5M9JHV7_MONFR|nr:hypothetical protein EYC84_007860 [Monilinia fructicola]
MTTISTTPTYHEAPLQGNNSQPSENPHQTLTVDFSWKKFKSLITTTGSDSPSKPLYIVSYKSFKPNLVFKSALDDSTLGTGTLHPISIDADCSVRGRPIKIKALKRFKTEYTHLSHTFSSSSSDPHTDRPPVQMTWTSSSGWKTWDFICLDEQQMPVAKFSANTMSLRNVGRVEFLGPTLMANEAFREEIVVVGMTLMYTMVLRSTSILSFFRGHHCATGEERGGEAPCVVDGVVWCGLVMVCMGERGKVL